jgi:hypothetical protein
MFFRCGGTMQNPARAAMRPPVTTNGNAVCAKSLVSNAQCVRIKLSSCGAQYQREPPSSWVSIQCYRDGTCYLLVADFDREDWRDALAYVKTCDFSRAPCALGVPVPGMGHMFGFSSKSQSPARRLGFSIITDTMERVPDIGFRSDDRFFPSQDTWPIGGFGNLIALPRCARSTSAAARVAYH